MTELDASLARRVEEASLNAWPALHQLLLDGWVLRFARGFTKRANSVVPLYPSTRDPFEKVRFCENLYAREHLTPIFRLTSIGAETELDRLLAMRGYALVDPTLVLACALDPQRTSAAAGFRELAQSDWLEAYGRITATAQAALALHRLVLNGIRTPLALGAFVAAETVVACGIAVVEAELVGLFDVATHPSERRRGFGRALVESLLAWGSARGAGNAYLQVLEQNTNARALYRGLGFAPLYRYWYRVAPH